jgi:uncharacterized protein YjdB
MQMRKKFILLPVLGVFLYVLLSSYSSGPGSAIGLYGYSTGCGGGGCHSSGATASTTVVMQLFNGATPVTSYVSGGSYTIRITGTQTSGSLTLPKFGFQVSAVLASSTTTNAGTMTAIASTHTSSPGGINIVEHSTAFVGSTGLGGGGSGTNYIVDIPWTASATTGSVLIRGIINSVNGNGGADGGDFWNIGASTIPELTAITGTASVCVSGTTTLSNSFSGGTWSTASGNASVGATGIVTGIAAGTATITYTGGGNIVTTVVTVNPNPGTFSGTMTVCQGQTTTLTNSVSGGTFSSASGNVSVATGGVVTGVNAGTALITYAIGTCSATATVTVNANAAIAGTLSVCQGNTTALTNANPGGTWASSVPANGSVSTTGVVTGILAGTTNITYALSGCNSVATVSVNAQPSVIGGSTVVCIGSTITATNSVSGGTWTQSAGTGSVTIDPTTGVITPGVAGTANVIYTLAGGCNVTEVITVNPLPAPITGGFSAVCNGSSITLSSFTTGGTWLSGNTSIATVGATGITTGVSVTGGIVPISYTLSTGCRRIQNVTVNALSPISGTLTVCTGATTTLSSGPAGGTWASSTTAVGTVSSSGAVAGLTGGTTGITYTTTTGCTSSAIVTVGALSSITGGGAVCAGSTLSLGDVTTGGTWTSSAPAVGTVDPVSGIVSALTPGTTTIVYTTGSGCSANTVVTVNAAPGAVTAAGSGTFCNSTTITASGGSGGTIYFQGIVSLGTSTATPSTSQLVTSSGTYYFRVQSTLGCWGSQGSVAVTINPTPTAITGTTSICTGANATLASTPAGGTWASSSTGNITVGSSSGIITGVSAVSGTATITYNAGGCAITTVATVNPLPADFVVNALCVGATATLSTTPAGGTWLSGNTGIATVGASSGLVAAIGAGTSAITYTSGAGCSLVKIQTVNAVPAAITGTTSVCVGATTTLATITTGGTWSSSDASKASVISGTGVVSGVAAGTAAISYTITTTGCSGNVVVSVNPNPTVISGGLSVCVGGTTALTSTPTGGTWLSGNTTDATVGSSSGIVSGVLNGTSILTYTLPAGCITTSVVTVNPLPTPITGGATFICQGSTTTLTASIAGGTWTSPSGSITIGSSSGTVTGVIAGTATITYSLGTGCQAATTITVNPLPAAIAGSLNACLGATTTLTSTPAGGTWTSINTSVATVGSGTGVVSGAGLGTSVVSYTLTTGCGRAVVVTVNANPAAITGAASTCVGTTTTLATTSTGGTWSSSSTANATVGAASGVVTGVSVNTVTISYSFSNGCFSSAIVTVNAAPTAGSITGSASVCTGLTIALADVVSGGAWSASNGNATVSSAGVVTGVTAGVTTITYTVVTPCGTVFATKDITITTSAVAGTISGSLAVCVGSNTTLSSSVTGGTWISSNTVVATIGLSSGVVTGAGAGTTTITYAISSACGSATITATVTVNALPSASGGTPAVCVGQTTTLTNVSGTWATASAAASVGSATGIVTGVSAATALITFTQTSTGCINVTTVTVNALPNTIGGTLAVCAGTATTLTETSTGGTWTSGTPGVAIIGSATGTVTPIAAGTSTISYTIATGCVRTATFTVNPTPAAITGTTNACVGATTTLGNTLTGGTWASSNTAVATIDPSAALVTGIGAGTSVITYTLSTGCRRTTIVTINSLPAAIGGTAALCAGATTMLSTTPAGGTWSTSDGSLAIVGSSSGIVTGVASGNPVITYTGANTCFRTINSTVNPLPAAIAGTLALCVSGTTSLTDGTPGGNWISAATSTASVSTGGIVTGIAAGTTTISYGLLTGCVSSVVVTVNALPAVFSGSLAVCQSGTVTLGSTPAGGTWSSSIIANATIGSSSGVVNGVAAGTSSITYTVAGTGCARAAVVTVNPLPGVITGTASVCAGATTTLSSTTGGGTWGSGTTSVATVGSATGIASGVLAGTAIITYTLGTGCQVSRTVTVNPLPVVTGVTSVCPAATITLTGSIAGGTWSSSVVATASVGAATGVVTGVAAGTVGITYSLPTGCNSVYLVTVNPLPSAGAITGASAVCVGANVTMTDAVAGGIWSEVTGKTSISTAGVVTGIAAGVDTVMYTVNAVCGIATAVYPVTVNPLAVAGTVSGIATVCVGTTATLADAVTGGVWSSSNTAVATVGSSTGVVTGAVAGTTAISYTVTNSCNAAHASTIVTVLAAVDAGTISGPDSVCQGDTISLSVTGTGGTWSSSAVTTAFAGTTGLVLGVTPGTAVIRYIVSNVCSHDTATHIVAVRSIADCTARVDNVQGSSVAISVFPNPNKGSFTVELPQIGAKATITILDAVGRIIETRVITDRAAKSAIFNLINVMPGNYIIKLDTGDRTFREQVVIW